MVKRWHVLFAVLLTKFWNITLILADFPSLESHPEAWN
jgi:hypothetical protein